VLSTRSVSDKVYQVLAHGRLFSHGTPTSSTTKTGRYDIAEVLLKVALNIKNKNSNLTYCDMYLPLYVLGKLDLQQVSTSVSYLIYETEKK
jgi:hypothetical protein